MATTFSLSSYSYSGRHLVLSCTQVADITNNKSTINWTLTSTGGSAANYTTGPTKVVIDGVTVYEKERVNYTSGVFPAARGSVSGTLSVNHNNYGEKSVTCSIKTAIYEAASAAKTSTGTWALDAIPRKAILESAPNFNDTENPTITYTNYAGSSVSSLQACISLDGGANATIPYRNIPKTGTSYTFNLTTAERNAIYSATTDKKSITAKFFIKTVNDGTTFYSTLNKTLTIIDSNPDVSLTVSDSNTTTANVTGDANRYCVLNASNLAYTLTASGVKGATIVSKKITCGTDTKTSDTGTFTSAKSNNVIATVTDSRGNVVTATDSKIAINYFQPTCNLTVDTITSSGTTKLKIEGQWFNDSFGSTANTITLAYRYKTEEGSWSSWTTTNSPTINMHTYTRTVNKTGLDYRKTYIFEARAKDKLTTIYSQEITVTSIPLFYWGKEKFNFNIPVSIDGKEITDWVIEEGRVRHWHFRKWANGTLEQWCAFEANTGSFNQSSSSGLYVSSNTLDAGEYPEEFGDIPMVTASNTGASGWIMQRNRGTTTTPPTYSVVRTFSGSASDTWTTIYAIGEWDVFSQNSNGGE